MSHEEMIEFVEEKMSLGYSRVEAISFLIPEPLDLDGFDIELWFQMVVGGN